MPCAGMHRSSECDADMMRTGSQALHVSHRRERFEMQRVLIPTSYRMLETPQDETVVRWGNEGDSFVVLEVRARSRPVFGDPTLTSLPR